MSVYHVCDGTHELIESPEGKLLRHHCGACMQWLDDAQLEEQCNARLWKNRLWGIRIANVKHGNFDNGPLNFGNMDDGE